MDIEDYKVDPDGFSKVIDFVAMDVLNLNDEEVLSEFLNDDAIRQKDRAFLDNAMAIIEHGLSQNESESPTPKFKVNSSDTLSVRDRLKRAVQSSRQPPSKSQSDYASRLLQSANVDPNHIANKPRQSSVQTQNKGKQGEISVLSNITLLLCIFTVIAIFAAGFAWVLVSKSGFNGAIGKVFSPHIVFVIALSIGVSIIVFNNVFALLMQMSGARLGLDLAVYIAVAIAAMSCFAMFDMSTMVLDITSRMPLYTTVKTYSLPAPQ